MENGEMTNYIEERLQVIETAYEDARRIIASLHKELEYVLNLAVIGERMNKIEAIKLRRRLTGEHLKDAKDWVEANWKEEREKEWKEVVDEDARIHRIQRLEDRVALLEHNSLNHHNDIVELFRKMED
jgi:ribosomal protein L7/L12